jgi:biotin transporter BioY
MGVHVDAAAVGAFVALILAAALIIGMAVARRRGALRSRNWATVLAVIVAALVIYGMGFGVLRPW